MKQLFIAILALFPVVGTAQEHVSLEDCIRMAQSNNKKIKASECLLKSAEFQRRSAKGLFFPSFSLEGAVLYSTSDGTLPIAGGRLPVLGMDGKPTGQTAFFPGLNLDYEMGWIFNAGIQLKQPIYMGGKIRAGYQMSKIGQEMAQQNKRLTEAEVIVATSRAYAEVVRTKELMQVARSYHNLLTELKRTVEKARQHGMKPQNDVLKVEVKLNESELNLRRATNGHCLAMMNLCHYVGRPLSDSLDVDSNLPEPVQETAAESSILNRPEYLLLEKKKDMAHQKVLMARSDYLPQIGLVGNYGYANGVELNGQKLMDGFGFHVGLKVSVPLFDFGHRINKIKTARAQYEQTCAEHDDTGEMLQLQMNQSFNQLDEAFLEKRLAESSVASANENLRSSRLHYEQGMETMSDYLEAQTMWQKARQTQVDARVNCYLTWLEYLKATGKIN